MKGVILAGGSGTRLLPSTKVTNKHLLPVYNKPMIYYPIETMLKAGISDILIMPGKDHAGAFASLLGSGSDFDATFTYKVQDRAGGLAYAAGLAEGFVGNDSFMLILGDNIILDDLSGAVKNFAGGAHVFLKQVPDPQRFGIADLDGTRVKNIIEKPVNPPSNWAVTGVYVYDSKAFEYIRALKPSDRGEVEITDLNNSYVQAGAMQATFLKEAWFDAGTSESLVEAAWEMKRLHKPSDRIKHETHTSPKVSVGFLLYHARPYLPEFIKSLKMQDYSKI